MGIEYSPMPEYVKMWAKMLDSGVKTALVPYMTEYEPRRSHGEIQVDLKFQSHHNTFSLRLTTEEGTVKYNNISLPESMKQIVPVVAGQNQQNYVFNVLKGITVYPKCVVGDHAVETFSKKSCTYALDDCYHVLSADGSQHKTHSVLAKEVQGKKYVKSFVLGSKVELKPTQQQGEYEVEVDGQVIRLTRNERREVVSQNRKVTYRLHMTSDRFVVVETPYNRISTNGEVVEIENTRLIPQTKLQGLCGAGKGYKSTDILTAQSCVAQSQQSAALTYRIKDHSCSPLNNQQQVFKQQKIECNQKKVIKSPITQIVKGQLSKCSQMKHAMIKQTSRLCISPDRRRVINLYEEKVMRGDILPELRNMDRTFTTEMHVPITCSHPAL